MKIKTILALLLLFTISLSWSSAISESVERAQVKDASSMTPLQTIDQTVRDLVKTVQAFPNEDQIKERRQEMRIVINPRFDFKEMAKRSLGAAWLKITPEQQTEFTNVFSKLLAKTYLNRIETIEEGMVKILGQKVREPKAIVKTTVKYEEDTFPLDYRLLLQDGNWRIYDVIIENIGLVQNYRNEFKGIIRKEKFSGLMTKLKDKLKDK